LKLIRYIRIPLLAMLFFTLLATLSEKYLLSERNGLQSIEKFNNAFRQKQVMTRDILGEISEKLDISASNPEVPVFEKLSYLNDLFEKRNF